MKWIAILFIVFLPIPQTVFGQAPATPAGQPPPRAGGFVPGQKRAPEDPALVTRGKTLFDINCRGCHGGDLRGGDMGGPNLLRSPVALTDQHGEMIVPVIHGSRQQMGMPAIGINDADAQSVAAYVRTVVGAIGVQGRPPSEDHQDPSILIGNASEGKSYFDVKCSSCHTGANDLKGIAAKYPDPKKLQSAWVSGARGRDDDQSAHTPKADVTLSSGEQIEGLITHLDDFLIAVQLPDGTQRSIVRTSDTKPKIVIHDPMQGHRDLMPLYTDKDIHDVTAYLETLK